jgi:hypothetical protein
LSLTGGISSILTELATEASDPASFTKIC